MAIVGPSAGPSGSIQSTSQPTTSPPHGLPETISLPEKGVANEEKFNHLGTALVATTLLGAAVYTMPAVCALAALTSIFAMTRPSPNTEEFEQIKSESEKSIPAEDASKLTKDALTAIGSVITSTVESSQADQTKIRQLEEKVARLEEQIKAAKEPEKKSPSAPAPEMRKGGAPPPPLPAVRVVLNPAEQKSLREAVADSLKTVSGMLDKLEKAYTVEIESETTKKILPSLPQKIEKCAEAIEISRKEVSESTRALERYREQYASEGKITVTIEGRGSFSFEKNQRQLDEEIKTNEEISNSIKSLNSEKQSLENEIKANQLQLAPAKASKSRWDQALEKAPENPSTIQSAKDADEKFQKLSGEGKKLTKDYNEISEEISKAEKMLTKSNSEVFRLKGTSAEQMLKSIEAKQQNSKNILEASSKDKEKLENQLKTVENEIVFKKDFLKEIKYTLNLDIFNTDLANVKNKEKLSEPMIAFDKAVKNLINTVDQGVSRKDLQKLNESIAGVRNKQNIASKAINTAAPTSAKTATVAESLTFQDQITARGAKQPPTPEEVIAALGGE